MTMHVCVHAHLDEHQALTPLPWPVHMAILDSCEVPQLVATCMCSMHVLSLLRGRHPLVVRHITRRLGC